MLEATLFLLLLGLAMSVILAIAARVFYVWEDPRVIGILDSLPGANCGGCGYAGCAAAADAVVTGKSEANVCVIGGLATAQMVAAVMGVTVEAREPEVAWSSCTYGIGEADAIYTYNGARDCRAAVMLYGGSKLCPIGCIGLGSCVKACQFGALVMGPDNLPVVDRDKCVACGACVKACPKDIMSLTSATRRIVSEYTVDECTAPCQRACPTGIDIPGYIREIRNGHYEEALRIIKEKCPLPLICGRICPSPCEFECRRNLADEPVAINPLKRFVADYEMQTGRHINPYKAADSGKRTAVIGGGAEGLTAAYYLARLGHRPTILEAMPELGGILRYVISADRLPRDVLDHEVKGILEMGVETRTGVALGKDFSIRSLLDEGFDAVALTSGGFDSRKILRPGSSEAQSEQLVPGVQLMLGVLESLAKGDSFRVGKRLVIVDGGIKALEVARACRARGAEQVTIVSHWSEAELPGELHENPVELLSEGIEVKGSTIVTELAGEAERLTRIAYEEIDPPAGMPPLRESTEVDTLILAAGRVPELILVRDGKASDSDPAEWNGAWRTVAAFRTLPHGGSAGIFTPPEEGRISDSEAVVKAILSGRRLVGVVQQHYSGEEITAIPHLAVEADEILNVDEIENVATSHRERPLLSSPEAGTENDWIWSEQLPSLTEEAAKRESERCLACGLICYKKDTGTEP